jgi:hypothetical protein
MTTPQDYVTHYFNIYPNNKEHCLNVLQAIYPDLSKKDLVELIKLYKNGKGHE